MKSGFTLIETLVVTAILAIVLGAIAMSFAAGLRAWDEARGFGEAEGDAVLALDRMGRDVAGMFAWSGIPVTHEPEQLSFPGLVAPAGDGQFALGEVMYRFDRGAGVLLREERSWPDGRTRSERLSAVAGVRFQVEPAPVVTGTVPARVVVTLLIPDGGPEIRRTLPVKGGAGR